MRVVHRSRRRRGATTTTTAAATVLLLLRRVRRRKILCLVSPLFSLFSPFAFLFCALQHLRERHPVKDQQVTNTSTVSSSPAVKNSRISKPSSSTPKNRKKVIKEEEDADMPRHFDGEDELLGGGEGGDVSVGFDQEDHLGSGFLS